LCYKIIKYNVVLRKHISYVDLHELLNKTQCDVCALVPKVSWMHKHHLMFIWIKSYSFVIVLNENVSLSSQFCVWCSLFPLFGVERKRRSGRGGMFTLLLHTGILSTAVENFSVGCEYKYWLRKVWQVRVEKCIELSLFWAESCKKDGKRTSYGLVYISAASTSNQ
jgi:hypothetical protein